jgi:hypothetical protein
MQRRRRDGSAFSSATSPGSGSFSVSKLEANDVKGAGDAEVAAGGGDSGDAARLVSAAALPGGEEFFFSTAVSTEAEVGAAESPLERVPLFFADIADRPCVAPQKPGDARFEKYFAPLSTDQPIAATHLGGRAHTHTHTSRRIWKKTLV